jgi:hypothetical protein
MLFSCLCNVSIKVGIQFPSNWIRTIWKKNLLFLQKKSSESSQQFIRRDKWRSRVGNRCLETIRGGGGEAENVSCCICPDMCCLNWKKYMLCCICCEVTRLSNTFNSYFTNLFNRLNKWHIRNKTAVFCQS